MSRLPVMECPVCGELVQQQAGVPRKHYRKGTAGECPGGEIVNHPQP